MTNKILTGAYPGGYVLSASYTGLTIAPAASVGGPGVSVAFRAAITNYGTIHGTGGADVTLVAGGTVTNGSGGDKTATMDGAFYAVQARYGRAMVTNYGTMSGLDLRFGGTVINAGGEIDGVVTVRHAAGTIFNQGAMVGGVDLVAGGTVTSGSPKDLTALMWAISAQHVAATVTNYGTVIGDIRHAVGLAAGGVITNGSAGDTTALIHSTAPGTAAVYAVNSAASVINFGTIQNAGGVGVDLRAGGTVTNGSAADGVALIQAIAAEGAPATVVNFATIQATLYYGVTLHEGGSVTNGSATDTTAFIASLSSDGAPTAVSNFGTFGGSVLRAGGAFTNGSLSDTAALAQGVYIGGASGVVSNFGTILDAGVGLGAGGTVTNAGSIHGVATGIHLAGGGTVSNTGTIQGAAGAGVLLDLGGAVTNGSAAHIAARITGSIAVYANYAAATVINYGSLQGAAFAGVFLSAGGAVTNGTASDVTAQISGRYGVYAGPSAAVTVTNYGTILGTGGFAVYFGSALDQLNVEAGSVFTGQIEGGGGTLNLASGTGAISGLTSAGSVTVSGSMATTTFRDFATLEVAAGASFADTGPVTVLAGHALIDAGVASLGGAGVNSIVNSGLIEATGTLTLAGTVKSFGTLEASAGTLLVTGAVGGTGSLSIGDGLADFTSTFSQNVVFTAGSTGVLELAHSLTYRATVSGLSKTGANALDLGDVTFGAGTKATYSGTTASGTLTVTDGTHVAHIKLAGDYTGSTFTVSSDGHGGTRVVDPARSGVVPRLIAASAGFGAPAAGTGPQPAEAWREVRPSLMAPPTHFA